MQLQLPAWAESQDHFLVLPRLCAGQSSWRPFLRRALSTFLPPTVSWRARKPDLRVRFLKTQSVPQRGLNLSCRGPKLRGKWFLQVLQRPG